MSWRRATLVGLVWIAAARPTQLTSQGSEAADTRKTLAAGERYRAGWVHRLFLGSHYRDLWATAGGGLWFAFLNRVNTLTVAAAHSPERTRLYVRAGFAY